MADYIDRQTAIDAASKGCGHLRGRFAEVEKALLAIPSADVVPVVRCKDCIDWNSETCGCKRNPSVAPWWENDFCSYGARKDGAQDG